MSHSNSLEENNADAASFDSIERLYQCKLCGKAFCSIASRKRHELLHTGVRPFSCEACGKSFADVSNLKQHERCHTGEKPYECTVCGKSFSRANCVKRHERVHRQDGLCSCKACSESFVDFCNKSRHERFHSEQRLHNCKVCSKAFIHACCQQRHQRLHLTERPQHCKVHCEEFADLEIQKLHEARIHPKEMSCNTTAFKILHQSDHLEGREVIRTREAPNDSLHSNNTFDKASSHNSLEGSNDEKMSFSSQLMRPYQCRMCSKAFFSIGNRRRHEKLHSGVRPFKCEECNKSFADLSNLKQHERCHTGEKLYQCRVCSKSFSRSNCCKRHERLCSQDGSCSCKVRGKSFSYLGNMRKHEKLHTGETPYTGNVCTTEAFHHLSSMNHPEQELYNCRDSNETIIQTGNLASHKGKHIEDVSLSLVDADFSLKKYSNESSFVVKPFGCIFCDKMFAVNSNFLKHCALHLNRLDPVGFVIYDML